MTITIDFNKPVTTDLYTAWPTLLQASAQSLGALLDPNFVTTVSNAPAGTKRYNTTSGLIEQWSGTAWAAVPSTYARTDGSIYAGPATYNNNVAINWKDGGGTARRMLDMVTGTDFYIGDMDNAVTGGLVHVAGKAGIRMEVNSTLIGAWSTTGLSIQNAAAQLAITGLSESIRLINSAAYIGFWNTSNALRSGYIQANAGSDLSLVAENGGTLNFGVGSAIRGRLDTSGAISADNGLGTTVFTSNARNPIWRFMNASSYGMSYFQGSSGVDGATDSIGFHPSGTATAAGSALNVTASGIVVTGGNGIVVGMGGPINASGGRGLVDVNGTSNALVSLNIGSVQKGYMYHSGSDFILNSNTGTVTLAIGGVTKSQVLANGSTKIVAGAFTVPATAQTTSGAITLDCTASNVFQITLNGNMTSLTLNNLQDGQTMNVYFIQDGTGSRTMAGLTSANGYVWPGGIAGVLSTAAGARDLLVLSYNATVGKVFCSLAKGFA